jgi:uncharacterized protein
MGVMDSEVVLDSFFFEVADPILNEPTYQTLKSFIAHSNFSVYDHSLAVAELSYSYAKKKQLAIDYRSLIVGALLHDYYLYDWHKPHKGHRLHGFRHPAWSLHNALLAYDLNRKEKNIIRSHMWPLTFFHFPQSKEAWIVNKMDHQEANYEVSHRREDCLLPLAPHRF